MVTRSFFAKVSLKTNMGAILSKPRSPEFRFAVSQLKAHGKLEASCTSSGESKTEGQGAHYFVQNLCRRSAIERQGYWYNPLVLNYE